jgi:hypothetical protein
MRKVIVSTLFETTERLLNKSLISKIGVAEKSGSENAKLQLALGKGLNAFILVTTGNQEPPKELLSKS